MTVVTAVHAQGERTRVELDGAPWRTLPAAAVVEAGLAPGVVLDRARAGVLARAIRRWRAEDVALRALARRDHSRLSLDARLARAGIGDHDRREVIERAERSGLIDDARFAQARAEQLAARGKGDALILDDLSRSGIGDGLAQAAVAGLEPEHSRAAPIVAARGSSLRTARWLAARGFSHETVERVVADVES